MMQWGKVPGAGACFRVLAATMGGARGSLDQWRHRILLS